MSNTTDTDSEIQLSVKQVRRSYAEEIKFVSGIESDAIVSAFATVPRERFLGSPPWMFMSAHRADYWTNGTTDVRHVYHDILIAIDETHRLNNGGPSWHAAAMAKVHPKLGDRVVHIGCGTGYYSAILAEIVGANGSVLAVEVNEQLAARAHTNLEPWTNVQTVQSDGASYEFGMAEVIYVNAGIDQLPRRWIECLAEGASLLAPLTLSEQEGGRMLLVRRNSTGCYKASLVQPVHVYPCVGARSEASTAQLRDALKSTQWRFDGWVRLDKHVRDSQCWLHHEECCLSLMPAGT